jgi:DNA polymerase-1
VSKERRWSVSQVIQGTASLIFKKAIINLAAKFGPASILLPMHDAVLMQFPDGEGAQGMVTEARDVMVSAFSLYCPGLSPRVTTGSFG